jgi:hypothetical protein
MKSCSDPAYHKIDVTGEEVIHPLLLRRVYLPHMGSNKRPCQLTIKKTTPRENQTLPNHTMSPEAKPTTTSNLSLLAVILLMAKTVGYTLKCTLASISFPFADCDWGSSSAHVTVFPAVHMVQTTYFDSHPLSLGKLGLRGVFSALLIKVEVELRKPLRGRELEAGELLLLEGSEGSAEKDERETSGLRFAGGAGIADGAMAACPEEDREGLLRES